METYSRLTRFCLCCNYVSRIIDPIASRCSKFRFKPLDSGDAAARLGEICESEGVVAEDGVVNRLLQVSEGDLRKSITILQSAHRLTSAIGLSTTNGNTARERGKTRFTDDHGDQTMESVESAFPPTKTPGVTVEIIEEIAGIVPQPTIDALVQAMEPTNGITNFKAVRTAVDEMVLDGWSAYQVMQQLYARLILNDDTIPAPKKNKMVECFSDADKRVADGVDELLLMMDLCLQLSSMLA